MALHWATLINYFPCTCTYAPRVPCDDAKSLAAAGRIREQFHGLITDLVRNLISSPPSDERDTSLFLCPKKSPDLEWGVRSADGPPSGQVSGYAPHLFHLINYFVTEKWT